MIAPKSTSRNKARAPTENRRPPSGGDESELSGLYVDDFPQPTAELQVAPSNKGKKKKRAADRRRDRGLAPKVEPEGPETRTSLPDKEQAEKKKADSLFGVSGPSMTGPSGQLQYAAGKLTCIEGPEEGLCLNLMRWVSARTIKETFVPPTDHTYPHMQAE